ARHVEHVQLTRAERAQIGLRLPRRACSEAAVEVAARLARRPDVVAAQHRAEPERAREAGLPADRERAAELDALAPRLREELGGGARQCHRASSGMEIGRASCRETAR